MKKTLLKKLFIFTLVLAVFFSLGCGVYASSTTLKKGDKSDEVKSMQEMLKKLSYFNEDCTGYFGSITEDAVKAFQKDNKLTVDGIVGSATVELLKKKVAEKSKTTTSRGSSSSQNGNVIHIVKQGDSVWSIAKAYGVTTDSILKENNLTESSVLQIGDKLMVPNAKKTDSTSDSNNTSNAASSTHTVVSGDTASEIAEDYGVSLSALLKANNLTEKSVLKIGQVLIIPGDEADSNSSGTASTNSKSETQTNTNTNTNANTNTSSTTTETVSSDNSGKLIGEYLSWFDEVQYIFKVGDTAVVTDLATGKTFNIKRNQGHNHADVEPLTAEDTAVMKELYGSWSWDRRAVIVTVDGKSIAGSMNGMPHGNYTIKNNNFNGHFCIHFKGSKTHKGNKVDSTHQAAVKKSAGL